MKFRLIDQVLERSADRLVAVKTVTTAEEYLQDHFPSFPVLPGVLMIEALAEAGRALLADRAGTRRLVLGEVRALRYGSFVKPGETLKLAVSLLGESGDGGWKLKGTGYVVRAGQPDPGFDATTENAVSGRFTLRPPRVERRPAARGAATGPTE
ncbi:MAG: beta-hydroxyacyl-ACP dehydratase [Phycisphaerales bacterium]